jgi:uncharacterized protein YyaL (SSP411 family)
VSADEIRAVLPGAESDAFLDMCQADGSSASILRRDAAETAAPGSVDERLLATRQNGVRRFRDDEILADWNGLMITALARGLPELHAASFDPRWLQEAIRLVDVFVADHWDSSAGGFFQTGEDTGEKGGAAAQDKRGHQKQLIDGVVPSANSVALLVLSKLGEITGDTRCRSPAEAIARLHPADLGSNGIRYSFLLSAL